ncbi:MAG TPA: response regulator [Rectinemataceae bacterium]|nr:response regulator [Rectinemataceae bacterium]
MNSDKGPFLVVDDEPEICWVLERILRKAGSVCHTARDAKEAMALAECQPYRMAFLDAKLPDHDGLDLARRLLKSSPGIRIVIVSGYFYQDDPNIAAAIRSGLISAFVAKPFDHAEILRAIDSLCPVPESGKGPPVI